MMQYPTVYVISSKTFSGIDFKSYRKISHIIPSEISLIQTLHTIILIFKFDPKLEYISDSLFITDQEATSSGSGQLNFFFVF